MPKTEARILGSGDVGVWDTELVTEFTGDQLEMINEMAMEMTSELIPEMIMELTGDPAEIGDPDGCPLTPLEPRVQH